MSPVVSLLLVYDGASPNANQLEAMIENISQKRKGYFKVITIDCNTDDKNVIQQFIYCGEEHRKQLPALLFSEPNLNIDGKGQKNEALASVKPYQGQLD